jgi:hypothetical protein
MRSGPSTYCLRFAASATAEHTQLVDGRRSHTHEVGSPGESVSAPRHESEDVLGHALALKDGELSAIHSDRAGPSAMASRSAAAVAPVTGGISSHSRFSRHAGKAS